MPNHIQNWDMAYAMSFTAVNNKLSADFNANNVAKEKIRTSVSTIAANNDATVVLQQVIEAAITGLGYTATIPKPATFDLETCKTTIATAFTNHLLLQDKYKSPYLKYLETKKKDHPDKKEYDTQITQEKTYLETVVKIQVQNAVLAVVANKKTKFEAATEEVIKEMIKEAVAVMYPQNCCELLFVNENENRLNIKLKAWSLMVGSKTDMVLVNIPFEVVGKDQKGNFIIELNLNWVKIAQKTYFEKTAQDNVAVIKNRGDRSSNETLFQSILNNLAEKDNDKYSSIGYLYNRLFASLNVFETFGATDEFKWMYPTTVEYTAIDSNDLNPDLEDSVFGILCMTNGRKNKEKPAIDINIIPEGNGSAIIFTPALLMQNILKPKIMDLFCTDEDKKNKAASTDFTQITPTSFENDKDLYFGPTIANKAESNSTINPKISAKTFSFALDNNSLVLNFGEMTYNWEENENFKVALQHKMKGSFSTQNTKKEWLLMKEDISVVTPDTTEEAQITQTWQIGLDLGATAATTLLTSLVFEKWAKYYFIENANKSISSIYHNHVTNDMETLQMLLDKENQKANKKFIADLKAENQKAEQAKYKKIITYFETNTLPTARISVTLDTKLFSFRVKKRFDNYLIVEISLNPSSSSSSSTTTTTTVSLKIISTKSEFDNGGMELINANYQDSEPMSQESNSDAKNIWMNTYGKYLLPIRENLSLQAINSGSDQTFLDKKINISSDLGDFHVEAMLDDYWVVKRLPPNVLVNRVSLKIIPTKSEFDNGGMLLINSNCTSYGTIKNLSALTDRNQLMPKEYLLYIRKALKAKFAEIEENKKFIADLTKHKLLILAKIDLIDNTSSSCFVKEILEDCLIVQLVISATTPAIDCTFGLQIIPTKSESNEGGMRKIDRTNATMNKMKNELSANWVDTCKNHFNSIRKTLKAKFAEIEENKKFIADLTKHKLLILTKELEYNGYKFSVKKILKEYLVVNLSAVPAVPTVSIGSTVPIVSTVPISSTVTISDFSLKIIPAKSELDHGGMQLTNHNYLVPAASVKTAETIMKESSSPDDITNWMDSYNASLSHIRHALKDIINPPLSSSGSNQVPPPEPIIPFLNVAIGTTTFETQEFIKQLHGEASNFNNDILETKMTKVAVISIERELIDSKKVVYLILQMDIEFVLLKTNSEKNEYGGLEVINYKKEKEDIATMKALPSLQAPEIDSWMETHKAQLQEIRYALTLRIHRAKVFQEFSKELNSKFKWWNPSTWLNNKELKVGNLVLKKEFIQIGPTALAATTAVAATTATNKDVYIAFEGVYFWYSYLGLKISPDAVQLYGLNLTSANLKNTNEWKEDMKIAIDDFEKLYPDSVRQIVNELKRVAFPQNEYREFVIDFFKDTVSGTIPTVVSKLTEWFPPIDPKDDINNQGKIKDLERVVNKTLQAIEWPSEASNDLKLDSMDLNGNFRLSFHSLSRLLKGNIEKENQDQPIYTFPSYNVEHTVGIENTGNVDLTFQLNSSTSSTPKNVAAKPKKNEYKRNELGTTGTKFVVKAALKHNPPIAVASYTVTVLIHKTEASLTDVIKTKDEYQLIHTFPSYSAETPVAIENTGDVDLTFQLEKENDSSINNTDVVVKAKAPKKGYKLSDFGTTGTKLSAKASETPASYKVTVPIHKTEATPLTGVIETKDKSQIIYTFLDNNAENSVRIENTGNVDLTFQLEKENDSSSDNSTIEVKASKKEYKLSDFGTTGTELSVKAALKHDPPTTVASYTVFIKEMG